MEMNQSGPPMACTQSQILTELLTGEQRQLSAAFRATLDATPAKVNFAASKKKQNLQVHTLTDYGNILSQAESSHVQIWTFPLPGFIPFVLSSVL